MKTLPITREGHEKLKKEMDYFRKRKNAPRSPKGPRRLRLDRKEKCRLPVQQKNGCAEIDRRVRLISPPNVWKNLKMSITPRRRARWFRRVVEIENDDGADYQARSASSVLRTKIFSTQRLSSSIDLAGRSRAAEKRGRRTPAVVNDARRAKLRGWRCHRYHRICEIARPETPSIWRAAAPRLASLPRQSGITIPLILDPTRRNRR